MADDVVNGVNGEIKPGAEPVDFRFVAHPNQADSVYLAPEMPPYFVPRAEFHVLKRQLIENSGGLPYPLALHGPAGSGKTALITALAHDADVLEAFPNGVLWISLAEGDDPQRAQRLWGEALGNNLAHLADSSARANTLRKLIGDGRYLLVLDNVTDVEQVRALNVAGPRCIRVISTDDPEHLTSLKARRYSINKMREDEALAMLQEWAGILPDIYLPTVREIVLRLAAQPLTLALVGGQARQGITWLRLLEVLREDQGSIASLKIDDPQVRASSLGLIANVVLSRFGGVQLKRAALLAAFEAGTGAPFSADAAAAAWELRPDEARRMLDLLVEGAVLHRTPGGYYGLHTALRSHLHKLASGADLQAAQKRVRAYYLDLIESRAAEAGTVDAQIAQIMGAYHGAAAQDRGSARIFADALMNYFERRGLWAHFVTLAAESVAVARQDADSGREFLYLSDLGYAHSVLGNLPEARAAYEDCLRIARDLGDPAGESSALNNLGAIAEKEHIYAEAERHYRASLAIREQLGMRAEIAETLSNLAGVLYWDNRHDEALASFQRVLDMFDLLEDRPGQAQTWLNIGAVFESIGGEVDALGAYQRSLAIWSNLGDQAGEAQALNNIGIIYLNRGDSDRALDHFRRSLNIKEALFDDPGVASTVNNIAQLYERTGSPVLALEHYERSYKLLHALDDPRADLVLENIQALQAQLRGE